VLLLSLGCFLSSISLFFHAIVTVANIKNKGNMYIYIYQSLLSFSPYLPRVYIQTHTHTHTHIFPILSLSFTHFPLRPPTTPGRAFGGGGACVCVCVCV
jgi:hypothetical protein